MNKACMIVDRQAVARWLKRIAIKHSVNNTGYNGVELKALHGQDYRERVLDQKSNDELMWDALIDRAVQDGGITDTVLNDVMGALKGTPGHRYGKDFIAKVKDKGHHIVKEDQTNVELVYGADKQTVKRKVFYRINSSTANTVDLGKYWNAKPKQTDWTKEPYNVNQLTAELRDLVPASVMAKTF